MVNELKKWKIFIKNAALNEFLFLFFLVGVSTEWIDDNEILY